MTDRELSALMQRVLLDSLKLDWEKKLDPASAFVPSVNYTREVNAMLADPLAWERKRSNPVWKSIVRRVAVVLLIISLGFGGLMAASPTVRAAFVQWITEWYETHVTYRYTAADIAEEMPQYEVTELPEGYVEYSRIEEANYTDIIYLNEETRKTIHLDYIYMQQGAANDFVTDDLEILAVTVNGMDGQIFLQEDWENKRSTITWIDLNRDLQFSVHAYLDKTDILHIAESVSLVE